MRWTTLLVVVGVLLASACPPPSSTGPDPDEPDDRVDPPSCSTLAGSICEAACACGGCALVNDDGERLELRSQPECLQLFTVVCDNADGLDTAACLGLVQDAACDGDALVVDERCDTGGDARCGDNIIQPPETCDPPGTNVCDDDCQALPFCGDNSLDDGEECDDGNFTGGDGCLSCRFEFCGDGVRNDSGAEACDDGNAATGDGCRPDCSAEVCGDDVLDAGEDCDDGNVAAGDGCDGVCRSEDCGNGVLDRGERCDDGNTFALDFCGTDCRPGSCQNDIVETGERCWLAANGFAFGLDPVTVLARDLDGDGETVLVASRAGQVAVIAMDASGVPLPPTLHPLQGSEVQHLLAGDLEGDGDVDVVVITAVGFNEARLEVLRRVAGAFVADGVRPLPRLHSVRLLDLDDDGDLDLAASSLSIPRRLEVLHGEGSSFAASAEVIDGNLDEVGALEMGAADLQGDGTPELVVFTSLNESFFIYPNVAGVFGARVTLRGAAQLTSNAGGLLAADVDDDGRQELLAYAGNFGVPGALLVLHDEPVGGLQVRRFARSTGQTVSNVIDIDADGDLDVLLAGDPVAVNDGDGVFTEGAGLRLFGLGAGAEIDLDDDGDQDLAWTNFGSLQLAQRSGRVLTQGERLEVGRADLLPLELNDDGAIDLLLADTVNRALISGQPGRTLVEVPGLPALARNTILASTTGDIDSDGDDDLFVQLITEPTCRLLLSDGAGGFTEQTIPGDAFFTRRMVVVDVDGDLIPDLVRDSGQGFHVLRHDGALGFTTGREIPVGPTGTDGALIFADLNDDGLPDAIVQRPVLSGVDRGRISIALNAGNDAFLAATPLLTTFESEGLAVGDLDGDGRLDVVTSRFADTAVPGGMLLLFSGRGDGTFDGATSLPSVVERPAGLIAADLDHDGGTDLLVYDQFDGLVEFRFQADGLVPTSPPLRLPSSAARERLILDVNDDGVVDLVWRAEDVLYTMSSAP